MNRKLMIFICAAIVVMIALVVWWMWRIIPPLFARSGSNSNSHIAVASMTYKPDPVRVGDKVVFDYVLTNMGTAEGTYSVDLIVDGRAVSFDHANPSMQPGGKARYGMSPGYFNWQPANTGRYYYHLVIVQPHRTTNYGGEIDVLP